MLQKFDLNELNFSEFLVTISSDDQCIYLVTKALRTAIHRPNDLVAHYGGEKFICLLPDTQHLGAMNITQLIVNSVLTYICSSFQAVTINWRYEYSTSFNAREITLVS